MTQITLRIASIGDIHNNQINLAKVQTYLTAAKNSGKLDFFVHPGDMSSSSSNSSQMSACKAKFDAIGTPYFVACGNHDVSGSACYKNKSNGNEACGSCNFKTIFGYCHRITTFNKNGQDFQIVIPGILWSGSIYWKIDLASASKTLPTVVVVHGPLFKPPGIPSCGAWDSLHMYTFSLKPGVDALKTMATYSGHVHEACVSPTRTDVTPTTNTLYVVQDAIGSSRCSSSENNFIGYTKITYDTTTSVSTKRYKKVNYTTAFVDPFPDVVPVTPTSIVIAPEIVSININGTVQLTATCKDQNNGTVLCPNLTWTSDTPTKATVNATGNVTGIASGMANITAMSGHIVSNISAVTVTTISPPTEKIVVTNPTAELSWIIGTGHVIRWTHTAKSGSLVKIELLETNKVVKTLSTSTANDNQFAWTVPKITTGTDYQIKITSNSNNAIFGISDKFNIGI